MMPWLLWRVWKHAMTLYRYSFAQFRPNADQQVLRTPMCPHFPSWNIFLQGSDGSA